MESETNSDPTNPTNFIGCLLMTFILLCSILIVCEGLKWHHYERSQAVVIDKSFTRLVFIVAVEIDGEVYKVDTIEDWDTYLAINPGDKVTIDSKVGNFTGITVRYIRYEPE
jgi:hypothetical protein